MKLFVFFLIICFSFKNPLNVPLTSCSYTVEGPGLQKPKSVGYRDVQPNELVDLTETFKAKRVGERQIIANFTSNQIQGVTGSTQITIQP